MPDCAAVSRSSHSVRRPVEPERSETVASRFTRGYSEAASISSSNGLVADAAVGSNAITMSVRRAVSRYAAPDHLIIRVIGEAGADLLGQWSQRFAGVSVSPRAPLTRSSTRSLSSRSVCRRRMRLSSSGAGGGGDLDDPGEQLGW